MLHLSIIDLILLPVALNLHASDVKDTRDLLYGFKCFIAEIPSIRLCATLYNALLPVCVMI